MPINPNIVLQSRPPRLQDVFAVRESMERDRLIREQRQNDQAQKQAFEQAQGDPQRAAEILRQQGRHEAAQTIEQSILEQRQKIAQVMSADIANRRSTTEGVARLLHGVKQNPSLFPEARERIRRTYGEEAAADLGATYDPAKIDLLLSEATSVEEQTRRQERAAELVRNAPLTALKNTQAIATLFAAAEDDDDWQSLRRLLPTWGVTQEQLAAIPKLWSKDAVAQMRAIAEGVPTAGQRLQAANQERAAGLEARRLDLEAQRLTQQGRMADVSDAAFINRHIQSKAGDRPIGSLSPKEFNTYHQEAVKLLAEMKRAPRPEERTDDPALPNGVKQHLNEIASRNATFEQARDTEWLPSIGGHVRNHPRLDPNKALAYLESLYGKRDTPGGGVEYSLRTPQAPSKVGGYQVGQRVELDDGSVIVIKKIDPNGQITEYDIVK